MAIEILGADQYRSKAYEQASLILALATSRVGIESRLHHLAERQDEQLADLLHNFAYHTRKCFELASRIGFDQSKLYDRGIRAHKGVEGSEHEEEEQDVSIAFVLGRLIHSDFLKIHRDIEMAEGPVGSETARPWGFSVRSDRDEGGVYHFIFIEFLLEAFLPLHDQVATLISKKRAAATNGA